ncbi:universal stress protein [Aeromicrobium sp. 636]|uniref:Universal stress protein n=1 Tax=Aeromicrobium senzhongii TaxID=2663859 RepID=A0A8I0K0V6_9ACTN|nr:MULTISPECIES: universal stress protein [Aeromicrobium]MBC9226223.1 universal stress protein [Aeromicrobium senzhongii]MCQ3998329.1 universal stress protein [Aeromicrobium sp. 636]MTB88758.1 universal stress protein [Aeromicrobium senzhongii]QNL93947.1 universal stress protein [Aeromicrobium senzhongii]
MLLSGPIIVGHDGSDFSDHALRWALALADRAKLPVLVIRAWTMRTAPKPKTQEFGYVPPASDFADAVRERLEESTREILAEYPDVDVTLKVERGQPATVVVEASRGAALLVVGPRGLGGFKGLMLGSVSEHAVGNAFCPVVVVRGEDDPAQSEPEV